MKTIKSIQAMLLMPLILLASSAYSQPRDYSADLFKDYENTVHSVETIKIKYPDLTYDYNYDNDGKLKSVTIKGLDNPSERESLRHWLMNLQALSEKLIYQKDANGIYYKAEEEARPSQGKHAFYRTLRENIDYPDMAKRLGIEGVVDLKFTVDMNGEIRNLQAKADFDAPEEIKKEMVFEAKRAFKNIDQTWEPAEINNFEVAQWRVLPGRFKLDNPLPRSL